MSHINYKITFSGAAQLEVMEAINAQTLPLMHQAVKAIANGTRQAWQEAIQRSDLWSGEKDAYAASVKWRMTGDFSAMVETDYEHAGEIESGRTPRDLKKMLDTSLKVRRTTDGRRFLVIPMRHNTPGNSAHAKSMPGAVYALAKDMAASSVKSTGTRPSGEVTHLSPKTGMQAASKQSPFLSNPKTKQAATVTKNKYAWGGRLTAESLKGAGMGSAEAKRYKGMVRMDTTTPGGSKSSAFMTFRIMMDGQTGKWIVPAKPGLYLVKGVADKMQPLAEAAFKAAISKTVSG